MATTEQRDYFAEQLLPLVGANAARLPKQEVTGFLSIAGRLYHNDLMVVGRAVNGWEDGVLPSELAVVSSASTYAEAIFNRAVGDESCPMLWVKNVGLIEQTMTVITTPEGLRSGGSFERSSMN